MIVAVFIIPILVLLVFYYLFHEEITGKEIFLSLLFTTTITLGVYALMRSGTTSDTAYHTSHGIRLEREEYYETYKRRTCSRTVGSGKHRRTVYYDCSYCDTNAPTYRMIDNFDRSIYLTKDEYFKIVKEWGGEEHFEELNRDINYSFGCGQDGDMYFTNWNKEVETAKFDFFTSDYTNKLLLNKSAFNYRPLDSVSLKKVYNYGDFRLFGENDKSLYQRIHLMNARLSKNKDATVNFIIRINQPMQVAIDQERHWEGGNYNEVNIVLSVDDKKNIQWVYVFGWNKNKTLLTKLKSDLLDLGKIDKTTHDDIVKVITTNINKYYKPRNLDKDFDHLEFELSFGQMLFICIFSLILSIIAGIIKVKHDL